MTESAPGFPARPDTEGMEGIGGDIVVKINFTRLEYGFGSVVIVSDIGDPCKER